MADLPTQEELKNLTPEERIRRLRELEELRKKELDDQRKKVEEELAAAEALIKKSEDEIDEQVEDEEKARKKAAEKEESLEEKVGTAKPTTVEEQGRQYDTTNLYNTLERAAENLGKLYDKPAWDRNDQKVYDESKQQIERAKTYKLSSEKLVEDLGLAANVLDRMKYRH